MEFKHQATVTLAEVAEAAGVGESTVSRVLRNHGSFSGKTRDRVMAAVERLGYVPNRIAGTLASTSSRLVAFVIPSLSNIVFPDVLRGASAILEENRYQAVFSVTDYDPGKEEALAAAMLAWRPAAVMLAGYEHTNGTVKMLRASGCRIVELLDVDGDALDLAVGFSNRAAGRESAAFLLKRGYRRIGYVGHDLNRDTRAGKRFSGFCETLGAGGAPSPTAKSSWGHHPWRTAGWGWSGCVPGRPGSMRFISRTTTWHWAVIFTAWRGGFRSLPSLPYSAITASISAARRRSRFRPSARRAWRPVRWRHSLSSPTRHPRLSISASN